MDIVKTTYCGNPDAMAKAPVHCTQRLPCCDPGRRRSCQSLTLRGKLNHFLTITREAMDCGVGGVTMGRFVWDYPDGPLWSWPCAT